MLVSSVSAAALRWRVPIRPTSRLSLGAVALALLNGCSGDASGPDARLAPSSIGVHAVLQAQSATAVEVSAGYLRSNGARVELASTRVPLAGGSQQARLSLDLRPCLADAQRVPVMPDCMVDLRVRLLRDATTLDERSVPVVVRPGESAAAPSVTLYEVQAVRVTAPGVTAGTGGTFAARVEESDTLRLAATPLDVAGQAVAGRVVSWTSVNPSIARVDAASGLVTGVARGTATVQAWFSGRPVGDVAVTVTPPSVRTLVPAVPSFQLSVGGSATLQISARDARGNALTGRAITFRSSNTAVATVSATGAVAAVGAGSAVITASTTEGPNGATISVDVPVTVAPRTRAGALTGRLVDARTGVAVAGATIRVQAGSVVGATPGAALATVVSGSDGGWSTPSLAGGTVSATITPPATSGLQATTVSAAVIDGDLDLATIPLAAVQAPASTVVGRFIDATTGQPLTVPVTLTRIAPTFGVVGSSSGVDSLAAATGTTSTTVQPSALYSAPTAGTATLRARAAGFVDAIVYVASRGATSATQDIVLSPIGAPDVVRIVLTWGSSPSDLDSYLAAPTPSGGRTTISFANDGNCAADPFVCLDVDDVNGGGPETITIVRQQTGTYHYAVNQFSSDGTIATSGARVAVYVGSRLLRTFTPPAGSGEWWNVFDIVGGQIVPVNTYGNSQPTLMRVPTSGARLTKTPIPAEAR
ncbi:Ig-like domain-containing protein [Roseisolibacter agri]|uniref:BIG2 domain-containing protein n=1 Tax=Roseisolibacter agri TaxID=2014610 RepID=A0AA37Q6B4_9BACT|nr:Ig-like domain-containing protein [Roseisolibacter agri]GLC25492.1 hypothetical protein rosag_20050 [Roseisolibacter agri]